MRVLLFSHLFPNRQEPLNGLFNLSRAKALARKGCEVLVVAPVGLTPSLALLMMGNGVRKELGTISDRMAIPSKDSIEGIDVIYPKWAWPPRKFFWGYDADFLKFFAGKKIEKAMATFRPDAVVSSFISPGAAYAKHIKQRHDVPYISIIDGSDIKLSPKRFAGIGRVVKDINRYVDTVVFVSDSLRETALRDYDFHSFVVIRNGYDETLFSYRPKGKSPKRDRINLLSVGGLNPAKGHDVLLRALEGLDGRFHLTIIGSGELESVLKGFVREHGLGDRVVFVARVAHPELNSYLADSDIFCMPSRSEGLPSAPLEAMGCGLPVVASNIDSLTDIVRDGSDGLIFKLDDSGDLRQKILKASEKEWDRASIARRAAETFSWGRWADEMIQLINSRLGTQ